MFLASASRLVNRPSRLGLKSVDRRAQTCTPCLADGRSTDPVDRNWEQCSLFFSVDREVDRRLQRSDSWPLAVDRAVDWQVWQTPTASFFQPINLGVWSLFWYKILETLRASFSYFFQRFSPHIWEQIFPIKRKDLSRVFKWFLWVFLHHLFPCFLTLHLSQPLIIHSIGVL